MSIRIDSPVIILGAGASRGARTGASRNPPLDADFLSVAEAVFRYQHSRGLRGAGVLAWNSFRRHLRSAGLQFSKVRSWRLEQLSTFLEARSNLSGLQLGAGRPRQFAQALEALKTMVGHVLVACGGNKPCDLHELLFNAVQPSAVVTFNYDLIADQTLLKLNLLNWRRPLYRGAKSARWVSATGKEYFWPVPRGRMSNTVDLIKLHGSINWEGTARKDYRLSGNRWPVGQLFDFVRVPEPPYIIPPVAAKIEIKQGALRERWYAALDHLHDARTWLIWGYSFPQTDTITQVLFRAALVRNRRPKRVIIVNPDHSVVGRVVQVCQKVRTEYFTSIEGLLLELGVLKK